ncbi:hypothetical protein PRK78_005680 [Emydomyces testavorans]|uniref:C2 domain-containing protein n=1 Tax=Emydomyces testavorans TaxID=2070801 RepID=A0AAF0DK40_9EURO|nr:hypothetical protein PRK78_005680 [Emydomyces testavorans]
MLSKSAKLALGAHTAGIYADMSIDGPEIGTLVAIIDRAKNLPNRKTLGKQNPYCACRLAKEAKKTDTDMRGGQTPKWDQELRFTVHESPDYYQLKVSVFNDDKKTDLIGETWVDLKNVIVPGGGQSDSWHNLNCKTKYAGEIRIELTYYDTRPKDEAVVERRKEAQKTESKSQTSSSIAGPRQSKAPKRRPLPVDPTGATPARPSSADVATMPKKEPPTSNSARPSAREQIQSASPPKIPREYETPDDLHQQWAPHDSYSTPQHQSYAHPDHPYHSHSPGGQVYQTTPDKSYPQPVRQSYYYEPSTSQQSAAAHAPYQLDPQNSHPPPHTSIPTRQSHSYLNGPRSSDPASTMEGYNHRSVELYNHNSLPASMPSEGRYLVSADYQHEHQRPAGDPDLCRESPGHSYTPDPSQAYQDPYETPPHQSIRHMVTPERRQNSYPPVSRNSPRGTPEAQGYSTPDHLLQCVPGSGEHRGHHPRYGTPTKTETYRDSPLRQSVSQADYHQHRQYMQPQVQDDDEDGPPPPPPVHRDGLSQSQTAEQIVSEPLPVAIPEPLHIMSRTSPQPAEKSTEYIAYSPHYSNPNYVPEAEQAYSTSPAPSYRSAGYLQDRPTTSGSDSVPSSLLAGYDSSFNKEPDRTISDRHHGRRQSTIPPQSQAQTQTMRSSPIDSPERRSPRTVMDPRQVPLRKSVSPRPPPLANPDSLQGVPFSPDSYDVINPSASYASSVDQPAPPYDNADQAMEAARQYEVDKLRALGPIIGNDGRTIDPSDHLPADTWAPEPVRKSKKPEVVIRFKHIPTSSTVGSRPSAADREQHSRPRSTIGINQSYQSPSPVHTPQTNSSGRNRLQKTSGRPQSYAQPNSSSARDSSPRTCNTSQYSTSPNNMSTPPHYKGSAPPPYNHGSPTPASRYSPSVISQHYHSSGPPIPAKVPVQPGTQNYPGIPSGVGGDIDALSEEMKRIDIGMSRGGRKGRASFVNGYGR